MWTATSKNARKEVFVNQDKQCVASLRMIGHMQKKVIFLSLGLTWAPRIPSKNTSEQETNWTTLLDFFWTTHLLLGNSNSKANVPGTLFLFPGWESTVPFAFLLEFWAFVAVASVRIVTLSQSQWKLSQSQWQPNKRSANIFFLLLQDVGGIPPRNVWVVFLFLFDLHLSTSFPPTSVHFLIFFLHLLSF